MRRWYRRIYFRLNPGTAFSQIRLFSDKNGNAGVLISGRNISFYIGSKRYEFNLRYGAGD